MNPQKAITIFQLQVVPTLIGLLLLSGCTTTQNTMSSDGDVSVAEVSRTGSEAAERLEDLYWARRDSARMKFTQADVNFMTGMIAHHAQALIMSALADENDAGPEIRTLTSRIINAQRDEINTMQTWLQRRGQPVPQIGISGLDLTITGVEEHHKHMPGMLSQAQLEELASARGDEFDRLFLKYMIKHHRGAVTMVDELFEAEGAALDDAAFKLASDINVDQQTEIARMERMLERRTPASQ